MFARRIVSWLDNQLRQMMNKRIKIQGTQAKTRRGIQNLLLLQRGQSGVAKRGAFAGAVRGRGRGGQLRAAWGGRGGGLQTRRQILDRLRNRYSTGYLRELAKASGTQDVNKMYETHEKLTTDAKTGEKSFLAPGSSSADKLLKARL